MLNQYLSNGIALALMLTPIGVLPANTQENVAYETNTSENIEQTYQQNGRGLFCTWFFPFLPSLC